MGPVLFRAEGIGKSFGGRTVLSSAALWGEAGRITTLLGRNGSGKTTLFRIACGVLWADHGVIAFNGEVRERVTLARLARGGLMYVPQNQLLCRGRSVRAHFSALTSRFGAEHLEEAIESLRIESLMDRRSDVLSGGERMRVSAALALARSPSVLLIDEPLVGIAPLDQELVGKALRTLAERSSAVITSGHDARALLALSDIILWSAAGTSHYLGSPAEALQHHQFRREYLGPGDWGN